MGGRLRRAPARAREREEAMRRLGFRRMLSGFVVLFSIGAFLTTGGGTAAAAGTIRHVAPCPRWPV